MQRKFGIPHVQDTGPGYGKCVTASSLCLSLSTNPEFSLSLSHPNTYQIVIVIHQICHKQGQLCLHMPSTDFAHAQLRVNMTQKHNL